jgi:hypothetical protein
METKQLILNNSVWKQQVAVDVTKEEEDILNSSNQENDEARFNIIKKIQNQSFVNPSDEDIATAQSIYDQHKINNSVLISANITIPEGFGIINCKINGEHKQIRF